MFPCFHINPYLKFLGCIFIGLQKCSKFYSTFVICRPLIRNLVHVHFETTFSWDPSPRYTCTVSQPYEITVHMYICDYTVFGIPTSKFLRSDQKGDTPLWKPSFRALQCWLLECPYEQPVLSYHFVEFVTVVIQIMYTYVNFYQPFCNGWLSMKDRKDFHILQHTFKALHNEKWTEYMYLQ